MQQPCVESVNNRLADLDFSLFAGNMTFSGYNNKELRRNCGIFPVISSSTLRLRVPLCLCGNVTSFVCEEIMSNSTVDDCNKEGLLVNKVSKMVVNSLLLVKNQRKFLCNAGLALLVVGSVTYFMFYTQLTLFQSELLAVPTYATIEITSTEKQPEAKLDGVRFNNKIQPSPGLEKYRQNAAATQQLIRKHPIAGTNLTLRQYLFNYLVDNLGRTPYPGVKNYTKYVVARLGLSPLVNAEPLIPEFGPVINDVVSFRYPISIPPCQDHATTNQTIVILVNSAPGNFDRRKMIRQTWLNHLAEFMYQEDLIGIAGFAFVLGQTEDNSTQIQIEEEANTHGDIIQIEMADFYRNLSLKVAGLFNWLYKYCSKVDFVVKVDDDVYVNVRNVANFFRSYNQSDPLIMFGSSATNLWPSRDGKWNITFEDWPWKNYPRYFLGPAVLFPGSVILPLLAAFQTTPMMPIDDVYYTGICAEKAGVKLYSSLNSTSFFATKLPEFPLPCDLRRFVTWLTVSTNHMNSSHLATQDFYHNRTQCVLIDSNGINKTVDKTSDYSESVQFSTYGIS